MITDTLITPEQIKTYRPMAELDDERVTPFILEAQQGDLRPVLNDALYYDLMLRFTDSADPMYADYQLLINGTTYTYSSHTVNFSGIKPMLAYFTLARFVIHNPVNITRYGVVQKLNTQSEALTPQAIQAVINGLKSAAISYQNEVVQYLETQASVYPLYNTGGLSDPGLRKTSFNFFKA